MTTTRVEQPASNPFQLALGTGAFALCFAVFGSVSAMMPIMRKQLHLDSTQAWVAISVPVLLGSLGRIPLGMLTDRFGGRLIFSLVMACSIVPSLLMGHVSSFAQVVVCGLFIGIALASFSVGVGFTSGWYSPLRQGMALGVYGAGNVGQSLANLGSPLLVAAAGYVWGYQTFAFLLIVWLGIWLLYARNAPRRAPVKAFAEVIRPLSDPMSWVLSVYYFLTFGGFVAMSIGLPMLLTDIFKLSARDANFRTAGFVLLATGMRPIGGWLADRVGGRAILAWVFPFTAAMALVLTCGAIVPFTIGALGMAAAIGLGNGAVFKLVPQHFPNSVGSVTGLVGAWGGLGGFFPPLVLGYIHRQTGAFTFGFVLLSVFAVACLVVLRVMAPCPALARGTST